MAKNSGKQGANGKRSESATKGKLDAELAALFKLPVAEFTVARNALAVQLKNSGQRDESDRVKALAKPSITAWAVNQLYWQHREVFDGLIATGERFRKAQTGAKVADMRAALDARREALSELSDLATTLLGDAGHNPTPETIHRISTTLEAMSAYPSFPDDLRPGYLSRDIDPPGFESLTAMLTGATMTKMKAAPVRVTSSQKSGPAASSRPKTESSRSLEQTRQAKIAAAKVSLQEARSLLSKARATAQRLEAAQKKANAEAKVSEKQKREAEERFDRARVASEDANRRARSTTAEAEEAVKAVEDAKSDVESAMKELEKLFGE